VALSSGSQSDIRLKANEEGDKTTQAPGGCCRSLWRPDPSAAVAGIRAAGAATAAAREPQQGPWRLRALRCRCQLCALSDLRESDRTVI